MKSYSIRWQESLCTGCQACMAACMEEKNLHPEEGERPGCRIQIIPGRELPSLKMQLCLHCSSPVCVQVCPEQVFYREEETGLVCCRTEESCIGCGSCTEHCPAGAIELDQKGIAHKCDGCAERVRSGRLPACVLACPAKALKLEICNTAAGTGVKA